MDHISSACHLESLCYCCFRCSSGNTWKGKSCACMHPRPALRRRLLQHSRAADTVEPADRGLMFKGSVPKTPSNRSIGCSWLFCNARSGKFDQLVGCTCTSGPVLSNSKWACAVYCSANLSGGHITPSVTIGTMVTGHIPILKGESSVKSMLAMPAGYNNDPTLCR